MLHPPQEDDDDEDPSDPRLTEENIDINFLTSVSPHLEQLTSVALKPQSFSNLVPHFLHSNS